LDASPRSVHASKAKRFWKDRRLSEYFLVVPYPTAWPPKAMPWPAAILTKSVYGGTAPTCDIQSAKLLLPSSSHHLGLTDLRCPSLPSSKAFNIDPIEDLHASRDLFTDNIAVAVDTRYRVCSLPPGALLPQLISDPTCTPSTFQHPQRAAAP
jgi:hypothetical protein